MIFKYEAWQDPESLWTLWRSETSSQAGNSGDSPSVEQHNDWTSRIEQMIHALSAACNAVRSMVHVSNINTQMNLLRIFSFCYKIWNNSFVGGGEG